MDAGTSAVRKLIAADEAARLVCRGAVVMVGGFGFAGKPVTLVDALRRNAEATDLTVISNNLGESGRGLGRLLLEGRMRKAIGSYFTSNPDVAAAYQAGTLTIELLPQGTLAEAIRAGGAGIAAFYLRTGAGTDIAAGREVRDIAGVPHVLWPALHADVALIRARAADELGNLVYDKTGRNFNPDMAAAATTVIAEVDEVLPVGALEPEAVVTPHILVHHLVISGDAR